MNDTTTVTVLGLGAIGTALTRAWLAAGHRPTVWNRTPARTVPLAAAGAHPADSAADAVAANRLVVVSLLDDTSVRTALDGVDLTGRDLVNLVTTTPEQARALAGWARGRGARFLDGGVMAVPPMIGTPAAGGYVFYSGDRDTFTDNEATLAVPLGARHVGADPGLAALYDVALLSAMYGMFGGIAHAFALARRGGVDPVELAGPLADWLVAMSRSVPDTGRRLREGDYTTGVTSTLAMQVAGAGTLLDTAAEQGVGTELLAPYLDAMRRRLAEGHGDEDTTGVVDLLAGRNSGAGGRALS